jgi:hypothetical protein
MVPRGSRNSEPRGTKRTWNGDPVAMLSSLRRRGAKGIGRSVEVSFRRQTRSSFEPEGLNNPKGEQDRGSQPDCRFERRKRVVGADLPRPGKPEAREGIRSRTVRRSESGKASKEQAGNYEPGEVARRRAAAKGERKAVSRRRLRRKPAPGDFRSVEPWRSKAVAGSDGGNAGRFLNAKFGPCMPAGERTATRVTWNHF